MWSDEVERKASMVVQLLADIAGDDWLGPRLIVHGGTALNEFLFDLPRLSTDADLSYFASDDDGPIVEARAQVAERLVDLLKAQGYRNVTSGKDGAAGRTVRFRSPLSPNAGNLKVDLIFMNRRPLLDPVMMDSASRPDVSFLTMAPAELMAGKVKALIDRVAPRDLYDCHNISSWVSQALSAGEIDPAQFHAVFLCYASLSSRFPQVWLADDVESFSFGLRDRFLRQADPTSQLAGYLRGEMPLYEDLISEAEGFVTEWVDPRDDRERTYVEEMACGRFHPDLIFDGDLLAHASANAEAAWRASNITRIAGEGATVDQVRQVIRGEG